LEEGRNIGQGILEAVEGKGKGKGEGKGKS